MALSSRRPWSTPNPRHESLASGLARQVTRVGAQGRLEGELRSIAIDLLGPNESDEFPAACADWVATTTEAAVSRVSDAALEALVRGLDSLLVAVPPDVARHLDRARPGAKPDSTEPAAISNSMQDGSRAREEDTMRLPYRLTSPRPELGAI